MKIPDHLRIKFGKTTYQASADQKTLSDWSSRKITTMEAVEQIANNNRTTVTLEQFEANTRMLGYYRDMDIDPDFDVIRELPYGGELRRFWNQHRIPFSSINIGDYEAYFCERSAEKGMIEEWLRKKGRFI